VLRLDIRLMLCVFESSGARLWVPKGSHTASVVSFLDRAAYEPLILRALPTLILVSHLLLCGRVYK
jgi:hypothetical protein